MTKTTKLCSKDGFESFDCNEPTYRKFGGMYGHIVIMNEIPYFIPEESDGMDVENISDAYDIVNEYKIKGND